MLEKLGKQQMPIKQVIEEVLDSLLATDTTAGIGCDNMSAILIIFKK